MTKLLTQTEIEQALANLPGWMQAGSEITRTFTLRSFPAALAFVSAVGHLAERADHHPDILIRYRQVTLTLSTHSAGGLTEKDFGLAAEINAIA
ncbi:MAG: 4a-hydroxytetrahydrobiopterin dehydratase [Anaerolineae bacterium]